MPHQCTNCGRVFPDGSKEMLSGCPDCDGNKFQFHPGRVEDIQPGGGATASADATDRDAPTASRSDTGETGVTSNVDRGSEERSGAERSGTERSMAERSPTDRPAEEDRPKENEAQAEARSDVVSPEELESASVGRSPSTEPSDRQREREPTDRPDIDELRAELNEQFESIRIVNPGQYELNLMELYDRDEYIISLREDGRYVIEVPDAWDSMEK